MRLGTISLLLLVSGVSAQESAAPAPGTPRLAAELLKDVRAAAETRDWPRLSEALKTPWMADPRVFVGHPDRPGVAVPLSRVVGETVRRLSPEGLAAVRKLQDPTARLWLEEWKQTGSEDVLNRIVKERFHSTVGPAAADLLASGALGKGHLRNALRLWNRILEEAAHDAAPVIAAKVAHALAEAGRTDGLQAFVERMLGANLDGPLLVGGERTTLRAYLESLRPPAPDPRWAQRRPDVAGEGAFATGTAAVIDHPGGPVLAVLNEERTHVQAFRVHGDRDPEFLWEKAVCSPKDRQYGVHPIGFASPEWLTGAEGVLVGSIERRYPLLAGVDAATGKALWTFERPFARGNLSILLARPGGLLIPGLVGSEEGFVTCLDLKSGREQWTTRFLLPGSPWALPALSAHEGKLFFGGQGGSVACLDEETGQVEWVASTSDLPDRRPSGYQLQECSPVAPLIRQGQVVVPSFGGRELIALSVRTGEKLRSPGNSYFPREHVCGLAEVGDAIACVARHYWAFADRPLKPALQVRLQFAAIGAANRAAYAQRGYQKRSGIFRLDAQTGAEVEVLDFPEGSRERAVALRQGRLFLVDGKKARVLDVRPLGPEWESLRRSGPHSARTLYGLASRAWFSEPVVRAAPLLAEFALSARGDADLARELTWVRSLALSIVDAAAAAPDPRDREAAALAAMTLDGGSDFSESAVGILGKALAAQGRERELEERLFALLSDLAPRNLKDLEGLLHPSRRAVRAILSDQWSTDSKSFEAFERRAAAELERLRPADVGGLLAVAARYPATPSAGRALVALLGAVRDSEGLAAVDALVRESARGLPAELRRSLLLTIDKALPDVNDAEAGRLEALSAWIEGLDDRK